MYLIYNVAWSELWQQKKCHFLLLNCCRVPKKQSRGQSIVAFLSTKRKKSGHVMFPWVLWSHAFILNGSINRLIHFPCLTRGQACRAETDQLGNVRHSFTDGKLRKFTSSHALPVSVSITAEFSFRYLILQTKTSIFRSFLWNLQFWTHHFK